jgi:hypothetical protein
VGFCFAPPSFTVQPFPLDSGRAGRLCGRRPLAGCKPLEALAAESLAAVQALDLVEGHFAAVLQLVKYVIVFSSLFSVERCASVLLLIGISLWVV